MLWSRMISKAEPKDVNTSQYHHLMKLFPQSSHIREFVERMKQTAVPVDTKAYTMLVAALCKEGKLAQALKTKDEMLVSEWVPWIVIRASSDRCRRGMSA